RPADRGRRATSGVDQGRRALLRDEPRVRPAAVHCPVGRARDLQSRVRRRGGGARPVPVDHAPAHHRAPLAHVGARGADRAHEAGGRCLVRDPRGSRALLQGERIMSGTGHKGPSVIEQLAAYVTGEAFDRLPAATVVAARRAILDTLGVTLAGAVEPTAERVRTMIEHRRAGQEATIVGTSLRAAVEDAALANGTASHALDYD